MDWKEKAKELRFQQNRSWKDTTNTLIGEGYFPNTEFHHAKERIRGYIRSLPEYKIKNEPNFDRSQKIEYKSDGSTTFEGIIQLMDGEPITPEIIMKGHNLDVNQWEVIGYKTNFWQQQAKGGRKLLLYQSKISVKPKSKNEITLEDIDRYFDSKDYSKDKLPIECLNYDPDGEELEIDITDLHIGLLSWREETGADYDLNIAKSHFFQCINDVIDRCKGRKFKKIYFVTLGDIIHVDNNMQTTTKGTFQQVEGRLAKIIECAEDMLIDGITMIGKIAPVEVVYTAGNHDETSGYMLMRCVMNAFRNDSNVIFDLKPNPIKPKIIANNLIIMNHGEPNKKQLGEMAMNFAKEYISNVNYIEVHCGHRHEVYCEVVNGMIIRRMPKMCNSSYWEHKSGYGDSFKGIICYIWNPRNGLRDNWYTMI